MPKQCKADGCTYPVFGKGYCQNHQYLRDDYKPYQWKPKKDTKPKPRKPIRQVSKRREAQLAQYSLAKKVYMDKHTYCECQTPEHACFNYATEIHHKNGRNGKRLIDIQYFMAICRTCHEWIHANPKKARELGYLI